MPVERRINHRVPVDLFLTEFVDDHPRRAYASDISEHGLHLARSIASVARSNPSVQVEFRLPGTSELIWAAGDIRYDSLDPYFHSSGIYLHAMARTHATLVRDYVMEARARRLREVLERIRQRRLRIPRAVC